MLLSLNYDGQLAWHVVVEIAAVTLGRRLEYRVGIREYVLSVIIMEYASPENLSGYLERVSVCRFDFLRESFARISVGNTAGPLFIETVRVQEPNEIFFTRLLSQNVIGLIRQLIPITPEP